MPTAPRLPELLTFNATTHAWTFSRPAGVGHCFGWDRNALACKYCYAQQGRFAMPAVARSIRARAELWDSMDHQGLASLLYAQLRRKPSAWIRWFTSGDFKGPDDITKTEAVFRRLRHLGIHNPIWVPTRAWKRASAIYPLRQLAKVPRVTVRLSAELVDVENNPPRGTIFGEGLLLGFPWSTVSRFEHCPKQNPNLTKGTCHKADCRACWDPSVSTVTYGLHGHKVIRRA